ncbi:MAG: glycosyltransferase family 4 protein [Propionibacteriaceae bacterium]|nr:glycosyltransferase family 4 protein [Propionibacteriaceae bacterium]
MRVLIFSAQYLPSVGGVQRYTHSLARQLVSDGHQVTIVASQMPDTPWREVDEGVEVLRVPSWLPVGGRLPVPKPGRRFRAVMGPVWRRSYDVALVNTRFWPLSVWAVWQCRRHGIPTIVLEHGSGYLSLGGSMLDLAVHAYERGALWLVARARPVFYAVSASASGWLRRLGVTARGVLCNAVDVATVRAAAADAGIDLRGRLGLADGQLVIAYAGRLIPDKGLRELVEAMPAVRAAVPDAVLALVGDGPLRQEVEDAAAAPDSGVCWLGELSHDDTMAVLAQSDVVCLPSYSEGFATVVLEAAALGTPIVSTRVGGAVDVIVDDGHGLLMDDHGPATIAAALTRALSDARWRAEASRHASERVGIEFTWKRTAERFLAAARALRP